MNKDAIKTVLTISCLLVNLIVSGNCLAKPKLVTRLGNFKDIEKFTLKSTDAISWKQVGMGQGGGINCMKPHPQDPNIILYFNDMNGCYKSVDGGKYFKSILNPDKGYFENPASALDIYYSPNNPKLVIISGDRGVYKSTDTGDTWKSISENCWPELRKGWTLAVDPDDEKLIFVGTGDIWNATFSALGIYRTTNGGKSWERVNTGLKSANPKAKFPTIRDIRIDPLSPRGKRRIYAATVNGFYISENNGTTWKLSMNGLPNNKCLDLDYAVSINPQNGKKQLTLVLIVQTEKQLKDGITTYDGGVYISSDNGNSWVEKNGDLRYDLAKVVGGKEKGLGLQEFREVAMQKDNPNIIYIGASDNFKRKMPNPTGLYRTLDGGKTWQNITRHFVQGEWVNGLVYKEIPKRMAELEKNGSNVADDVQPFLENIQHICIYEKDPNILFFSVQNASYRSDDFGKTWKSITNTKVGKNRFKGHGNGNICCRTVVFNPINPSAKIFLPAHDMGLFWTRDEGETFEGTIYRNYPLKNAKGKGFSFVSLGSMPIVAYDPSNPEIVYSTSGGWGSKDLEFWKSIDGGEKFKKLSLIAKTEQGNPISYARNVVIDPNSPIDARTIYITALAKPNDRAWQIPGKYQGAGIKVSRDGGKTWQSLNNGFGKNLNIFDLVINPKKSQELFASMISYEKAGITHEGGLFKTTDGGKNWRKITPNAMKAVSDICIDWNNPKIIYATTHDKGSGGYGYKKFKNWESITGGLWKSIDGGKNWQQIFQTSNCRAVAVSPFDENMVLVSAATDNGGSYLTRNTGAFLSRDGGKSWERVNKGLGIENITGFTFHPTRKDEVWCGTDGAGWYKGKINLNK